MKKIILGCTALIGIIIFASAFKSEDQKGLARVTVENGYYIFVDCQPVESYDFIATIKIRDKDADYDKMKKKLFQVADRKGRKNKTDADGIIFHLKTYTADLIKFK